MVHDPRLFLRYDGLKYVTLVVLAQMKLRRGEPKDRRDVSLIEGLGAAQPSAPYRQLPGAAHGKGRVLRLARAVLPAAVRKPINMSLYALRDGMRALRRAPDYLKANPQIFYRGFTVSHTAGDALVDRIRGGDMYEPQVTRALLALLQRCETAPLFLDIGANIGLISLNLLSLMPSVRIHAFEPGPRTVALLQRTVAANRLEQSMTLHARALTKKTGTAKFAQHSRRHSSGDGFLDTGRAGRSRYIEVRTGTLDGWWHAMRRPRVDVIKIDTEGAELWVLEGGAQMIAHDHPAMVLEINSCNLANYAHGADAIETLLHGHGYRLQTLAGTAVPIGELARFAEVANDFIALPTVDEL